MGEIVDRGRSQIGRLGEIYTMLELAKRGVYSSKLDSLHDYDLLTEGDIKIEVKSSRQCCFVNGTGYNSIGWQFNNSKGIPEYKDGATYLKQTKRDRRCDFFVCVCFKDDLEPERYYIIPKDEFGCNVTLAIRKTISASKWDTFCNNWDLITKMEKEIFPEADIVIDDTTENATLDELFLIQEAIQ